MRHRLLAVVLASLLAGPSLAAQAPAPKTEVADLRYGVALFHYYQQDYIPAISELLVADARDGIQGHGNNPELIAGGLSLAFGMQHHAEQLFNHLLQDNSRPPAVRDAAWFYLGKLEYTRGDWLMAEQSLMRSGNAINAETQAERQSLLLNLRLKRNDTADYSLKAITQAKLFQWEPYSLYNLGAYYARQGDTTTAKTYFNELAGLAQDKDHQSRAEYLALLDKAHVALGYSYLHEQSYLGALDEFRKVRLDGIESNQALLGYGWAALAQENYTEALKPWQLLQSRSLLYPAAQEALLAVPYVYEKLRAPGDALREYQHAEQLLGSELALVRDMRATLTADELLGLVGSKPVSVAELDRQTASAEPGTITALVTDDGHNWLKLNQSSVIKTRSIYLRELFAQTDFQASVLDLRDLLKLQKLLQDWQPKLIAYRELLEQKQAWRQQKTLQVAQASLAERQAGLEKTRQQLGERLAAIKQSDDYLALADEQTRKTYGRVERSKARLLLLKAAGQDTSSEEEQLWITRGILQWRAAQDYPARMVDVERSLAQVDAALASIKTTRAHVEALVAQGQDLQPLTARIEQQQQAVAAQLVAVNSAVAVYAEKLRTKVDAQLASHEKRLNHYVAQSHFAVARLYDAALRGGTP